MSKRHPPITEADILALRAHCLKWEAAGGKPGRGGHFTDNVEWRRGIIYYHASGHWCLSREWREIFNEKYPAHRIDEQAYPLPHPPDAELALAQRLAALIDDDTMGQISKPGRLGKKQRAFMMYLWEGEGHRRTMKEAWDWHWKHAGFNEYSQSKSATAEWARYNGAGMYKLLASLCKRFLIRVVQRENSKFYDVIAVVQFMDVTEDMPPMSLL